MSRKFSYNEDVVGSIFDQKENIEIRDLLKSKKILTRGDKILDFEKKVSKYCNAKFAVAVSSCGAALNLTSKILNLKKGDEVICQGNMFWAGINHLLEKQIKIKCADTDNNLNISIESLKRLVTRKTKAIYIMHHGGYPCDLDKIKKIVKKYEIPIVEDCAHSLGSIYKGNKIGFKSDLACFSFSTLKNITTLGEGGMILTNNKQFYNKAKALRTNFPIASFTKDESLQKIFGLNFKDFKKFTNIGNSWENKIISIEEIGSTYRMGEAQAAAGIKQLKKLNSFINRRRKIANIYNRFFLKYPDLFERCQIENKNFKSSHHLYNFFVKKNSFFNRNQFANKLLENKIEIKIRFAPIHLNNIMRYHGCKPRNCKKCNGLPNLEYSWLHSQMSLPISPNKKINQIKSMLIIVEKIIKKFQKKIK